MKKIDRLTAVFMIVLVLIGGMTGLRGIGFAGQVLSLHEAIRQALQNNHEIKAIRNQARASEEGIGVARSWLLPRLSFEERYLRTVNPGYAFMTRLNQERITQQDFNPSILNKPDPINDFQTSLFLEQPLFTRKGLIGLEMSKADSVARTEDALRKEEEVAFRVVQAAMILQTAKAFLGVAEKSVEEAEEHLRIAQARHKNGLGQYADTLRAMTALSEAEQRKVSTDKNVLVGKRSLGLLLGRDDDVDIADAVPDIPLRPLDDYVKTALARRDIKSQEIRGENALKNIKMAEAGYFPYIGVGGAYQLNDHSRPLGSEGNNWQVTAFLRWDLFDGAKREYERARAKHEAVGAQEQIAALKKAVSFQVYEAYLSVSEAKKQIDLARKTLKSAEEGRRLVRLRYENGLYPLVDLLSAQLSLDQARATLASREGEGRLAVVRLGYESGTILKDLNVKY